MAQKSVGLTLFFSFIDGNLSQIMYYFTEPASAETTKCTCQYSKYIVDDILHYTMDI